MQCIALLLFFSFYPFPLHCCLLYIEWTSKEDNDVDEDFQSLERTALNVLLIIETDADFASSLCLLIAQCTQQNKRINIKFIILMLVKQKNSFRSWNEQFETILEVH